MINQVTLVGRLTKDPELRYTPNGVAVAQFTVAVNRSFTNKNGEQEADFINCVVWRKTAEATANYTKKGSLVGVTGSIQTRNYENQQGRRVYVTEVLAGSVQFLDTQNQGRKKQGGQRQQGNPYQGNQQNNPYQGNRGNNQNQQPQNNNPFDQEGEPVDLSDDDLPF